jgi:hypothetical protein
MTIEIIKVNETIRPFILHVGSVKIRLAEADLEEIARLALRWVKV